MEQRWVQTFLEEVSNILPGFGFPKSMQGKSNGQYPLYKVGDISKNIKSGSIYLKTCDNYIDDAELKKIRGKLLPKGTVVFAKIGEALKLNRRAITTVPCLVDNNVVGVKANNSMLLDGFLYFFLKIVKLDDFSRATTVPSVRKTDIEKISFYLPPLPEQRALVSKIEQLFSDLDNGIENFKKAQTQLKLYRQSVLKAACEGKLVPTEAELAHAEGRDYETADVLLARILKERREKWESTQLVELIAKDKIPKNDSWKKKYREPSLLENDDLPSLPKGWIWTNFEQIADGTPNSLKAGPFGSALKKDFYAPNGYKIYGQEQVIRGDPFYGNYYIGENHYQKLRSCAVKPGDILISLVGTIGKVLILPFGIEPGIINPRLVKLSLDKRVVNYKYIKAYLESPNVRHYFSLVSHGGTMDILNLTVLKELPIPLPPFKEQNVIVSEVERRLSISDKMEETITESLQKAEALRQSILKKAFEGKLLNEREQEEARNAPDWEPAEKLLDRIRREKQIKEKNNKPARGKNKK